MAEPSQCPFEYAAGLVRARIRELDSLIKTEIRNSATLRNSVKAWQDERKLATAHLAKLEAESKRAAVKAQVACTAPFPVGASAKKPGKKIAKGKARK